MKQLLVSGIAAWAFFQFDVWAGGPGQTMYETAKNKGIAKYAAEYPHDLRACGAWAQDFLKTAKASGKPFCMSISFKAPHMPFTPDPIDLKLYESKKTFARPANYGVEKGAHLSAQVVTGHGYEPYPTLFDRTISWEQKEPLLKALGTMGSGEGEGEKKMNKKKATKNHP